MMAGTPESPVKKFGLKTVTVLVNWLTIVYKSGVKVGISIAKCIENIK